MRTPHRIPERGSRLRTESGIGAFDRRALDVLREIDPRWRFSPAVSWLVSAIVLVGLGLALGGLVLAAIAVPAILLVPAGLTRLARHRRRQRVADHLADFCTDIARGLRAGQTLPESLDAAIEPARHLAPPAAIVAMSEHRAGRALELALDSWADSAPTSAERIVASALSIGVVSGGRVGLSLDLMSEAVGAELHAVHRQQSVTAQARYSARILTALPVGVAILIGLGTDSAVYSRVSVWIAVGVGVLMASLGWMWMNWQIGRVT